VADASLTHGVWLERVPDLAAECAEEWELRLGEPYEPGAAGHAVRAELADGRLAVLKLVYPDRESEHEADALAVWDGHGAVQLLARDDERSAILIERCEPGSPLAAAGPDVALDVLIALLPRLWVPAAEPFHSLEDEAGWWVGHLREQGERSNRAAERRLVDAAIDALGSVSQSQGQQVLLHQDLHGDNVLSAGREPWLVIDPKPLIGEREFAVAPIVRSFELGHSKRDALRRLDRLTSELGLDRGRARAWTIGQTMAWAFESDYIATHLDTVRWLLEDAE
jgi:streptomycin 6-kinase